MNIKKFLVAASSTIVGLALLAGPALAATTALGTNWRVYNVKPATNSFWDINKPKSDGSGGFTFPIQQFLTTTTGSFVVYFLNNYNIDMTGKTIEAVMNWTDNGTGAYVTRGDPADGAYVRLEFQDVTAGPYDSNDYWWSTGTTDPNLALDLNAGTGDTLIASLNSCVLWSNQSGKSACDNTHDWVQWQGDIVHASPAEGFANAVKNVKQVGLSFGRASAYASGVALTGGTGTFNVSSFTIQ